jgi:integrase
LPTLGEALEQMITFKSNPGREKVSRKRPMSKTTITNYRSSFKRYLSKWANVPVDALPTFEISSHLDALQPTKPQAAQRAAGVVSAIVNHVAKVAKQDLKAPGLTDPTATRSRAAEGGDIDMTIPLSARWRDIQSVKDPILRAVMELTVYTGLRARPLLELTWDRVSQVEVQGGLAWAITLDKPVKHQLEDREVVLGDDAGRIIERLRALRVDDCPWVFPSIKCDADGRRVHLFAIPTVGQTTGNTARHYWMPIARTHLSLASMKWLALHSLKGEGLGMAGHYGKPTHQEQYEAANVIGSKINALLAIKVSPANVVEMGRVRA